jgi:hypothetical protein
MKKWKSAQMPFFPAKNLTLKESGIRDKVALGGKKDPKSLTNIKYNVRYRRVYH